MAPLPWYKVRATCPHCGVITEVHVTHIDVAIYECQYCHYHVLDMVEGYVALTGEQLAEILKPFDVFVSGMQGVMDLSTRGSQPDRVNVDSIYDFISRVEKGEIDG